MSKKEYMRRYESMLETILPYKILAEARCNVKVFQPVLKKSGKWYVSHCPFLDVMSQGRTEQEAIEMLTEACELWLESVLGVKK